MLRILLFVSFIGIALSTIAQSAAVRQKEFNLERGVALKGYDPVAYLDERKAVEGNSRITATYQGVTYRFATTAHQATFNQNPVKYEPAYGGWCAYAMGDSGDKVDFDPETFKVENGKLYLFYNAFFNNTLPKWNQNEAKLKPQADANWAKFYRP